MTETVLRDSWMRTIENLRISVTDRCDLRCQYCIPDEEIEWMEGSRLLSFDEIETLARIFVRVGIKKVRITGGEPLLRKGLPDLVSRLSRIERLRDISLTTNGTTLARQAKPLWDAGLRRINVSLDSLDRQTFLKMTGRDRLKQVLEGLDSVERLGFKPIRINVVLVRGVNDAEVPRFAELARERPFHIRFIEFMPLEAGDVWGRDKMISGREARGKVQALYPLERIDGGEGRAPSVDYRFADGRGQIGFIDSISEPFCASCNRIRLTADGKLRTCLFSTTETDLLSSLRAGMEPGVLAEMIEKAVFRKEKKHYVNEVGFVKPSRTMSQIGG